MVFSFNEAKRKKHFSVSFHSHWRNQFVVNIYLLYTNKKNKSSKLRVLQDSSSWQSVKNFLFVSPSRETFFLCKLHFTTSLPRREVLLRFMFVLQLCGFWLQGEPVGSLQSCSWDLKCFWGGSFSWAPPVDSNASDSGHRFLNVQKVF